MPKIPEYLNIGDLQELSQEELLRIIQKMYSDLASAINKKPDVYVRSTDGQSSDTVLSDGDININSSTLKVEMLTEHASSTTVTWTQLS